MKIPGPLVDYLHSAVGQEFPKTKQAITTKVGCPSELHSKVLLLKMAEREEVKLPLGCPTPKWAGSILQTAGEGLSSMVLFSCGHCVQ